MRPMNGGGGGGGGQDRGNRIDNRARGNANQLHEKYKTLARDAQMQGDRVMTEYYLQFADHYFRVLSETRGRFEEQRRQRGDFQDDYDGDEADGEMNAIDAIDRDEDRPRRNDEDRPRRNGEASGHANGERQPRFDRRDRPERGERREREQRPEREERQQLSFADEVVDEAPVAAAIDEEPIAPRRPRGRPRRERPAETEAASRIDGERPLPAFLAEPAAEVAPPAEATGEEAPRRRRVTTRKPRAGGADTVNAEA